MLRGENDQAVTVAGNAPQRTLRVVILVDGGVVQEVYGSPDIAVEVCDFDNLEAEGLGRAARWEKITELREGLEELL